MKRFSFLLIVVLSTVVVSTFALAGNTQNLPSFFNQTEVLGIPKQIEPVSQTNQTKIPEHIPYMFLLLRYQNEKKQGISRKTEEKLGLDREGLRRFQIIAENYNREIEMIDNRAKEIIEAIQQKFPPGKLPDGVAPPEIPQELLQLQEKRDKTVLRFKDQLKNDVGAGNFSNIESFVNGEITTKISTQR